MPISQSLFEVAVIHLHCDTKQLYKELRASFLIHLRNGYLWVKNKLPGKGVEALLL